MTVLGFSDTPPSSIALIFSEDQQSILLVRRADLPVWVLPGGGIDPGESPEEAAIREAFEESGFHIHIQKKAAEYLPGTRAKATAHVFISSTVGGMARTSEESVDVRFFPLNQLPRDFFIIHKGWVEEILTSNTFIRRRVHEAGLLRLFFFHLKLPCLLCASIKKILSGFTQSAWKTLLGKTKRNAK